MKNNLINVDFKEGKRVEEKKVIKKIIKSNVLVIDFQGKKLLESINQEHEEIIDESKSYDMNDFNSPPMNSYFHCFSDKERTMHSDHILEYLSDLNLEEILHFVNMGVLDKKKLANKLNMQYC